MKRTNILSILLALVPVPISAGEAVPQGDSPKARNQVMLDSYIKRLTVLGVPQLAMPAGKDQEGYIIHYVPQRADLVHHWRVSKNNDKYVLVLRKSKPPRELVFALRERTWRRIKKYLQKADFWRLPAVDDRIGRDGFHVWIEGVKGKERQRIYRWTPTKSFGPLIAHLTKLSAVNPDEEKVLAFHSRFDYIFNERGHVKSADLTGSFGGSGDSHLEIVKHFKELETLKVHLSWITDSGFAHLHGLRKLRHLEISFHFRRLTDKALAQLAKLNKLQRLSLLKTNITDAGLVHLSKLPALTHLDLSDSKITDAGLVHLRTMKHLRYLKLIQTKVTAAGTKKLRKDVPGLTVEFNSKVHVPNVKLQRSLRDHFLWTEAGRRWRGGRE